MSQIRLILCIGSTCVIGIVSFFQLVRANAQPSVDSVTAAATAGGSETTLNLTEGTTKTLYVYGAITDTDGCEDVATNGTVGVKFYRSNHASANNCTEDNNDCYKILNASCTKTGCNPPSDNTFQYECTTEIQYYADSTMDGPEAASDWTAYVTAKDAALAAGTNSDNIEINTLVGVQVPASVNYGTVALDSTSNERNVTVTNTGNSGIDVELFADGAMTCGIGTMGVGRVHYSGTTGFTYAAGTALTTTAAEHELNLAPRSNDATPATKDMYFLLQLPHEGIAGNCQNILTINGKKDVENGW